MRMIIKLFFIATLLAASVPMLARPYTEINFAAKDSVKNVDEKIYDVVEEQPEFPGGMQALMNFLKNNVVYPAEERKQGVEGRVFVNFIVNTDGSISNVEILKSSGNINLDTEAVRIVSLMPKWRPGRQSGKPVRVRFAIPITFKLSPKNPTYSYLSCDEAPRFPSGDAGLRDWINARLVSPDTTIKTLRVESYYINMLINKDSTIERASVSLLNRPLRTGIMLDLMRHLTNLQIQNRIKWVPGKKEGKFVNTLFNAPVNIAIYPDGTARAVDYKAPELPQIELPISYTQENKIDPRYPKKALKEQAEGRVDVGYVVSKKGKIKNVTVARSSGNKLLDKAAVRIVKKIRRCTPGTIDGKEVEISMPPKIIEFLLPHKYSKARIVTVE